MPVYIYVSAFKSLDKGYASAVAVSGGYAFVADGTSGLTVFAIDGGKP